VGDSGVQESSRRGLSNFLAEHEDHGRGFDIQRREGSDGSIVRVICGGCGNAIEYPAASDMEFAAEPAVRSVSQRLLNRQRRPSPRPETRPERAQERDDLRTRPDDPAAPGEPVRRPSRLPAWLSAPLVLALIAGGLLLVVVGIASNGGTSDSTPTTPDVPLNTVPLTTTPSVPINSGAREPKLDRRRFVDRVSIGIPPGWNAGVEGPAVTVADLSGRAGVQVYFEHGARPDDQLMREARSFLLQRHTGASVARIGPTNLGGRSVRRVRVIYPTGTESATVLVAGGYSYLLLERLSKPFSVALKRTTDAVVASFRPI
jgi:hypothetical protein